MRCPICGDNNIILLNISGIVGIEDDSGFDCCETRWYVRNNDVFCAQKRLSKRHCVNLYIAENQSIVYISDPETEQMLDAIQLDHCLPLDITEDQLRVFLTFS